MAGFQHVPHPHIAARKEQGPVSTATERGGGLNAKIGLAITTLVGTMICGYVFLQLVLLPVIIVGQNIQAKASDKRAEQTYLDAEAVLHEAQQIQAHLAEQDKLLRPAAGG
jgi:hypothetical protein